jgi:hypothetical protein
MPRRFRAAVAAVVSAALLVLAASAAWCGSVPGEQVIYHSDLDENIGEGFTVDP